MTPTANPPASTPDALLTRPQAAEYLTISVRLLARLTAEGRITPVRVGPKTVRYRASELERYLTACHKPRGGSHG